MVWCNLTRIIHIAPLEIILLHFSMQDEVIIEHKNAKCHVFTLMINFLVIV